MIRKVERVRIDAGQWGSLKVGRAFGDRKVEVAMAHCPLVTHGPESLRELAKQFMALADALDHPNYEAS